MATNYGFLNDMASGIKEGLTAYQTINKNKRDEQMSNLLNGVQNDPVTGELGFTPEKKQQLAVQKLVQQRQADELDPNSQLSKDRSALYGNVLGPKLAPAFNGLSAADLKETEPLINTKLKSDENITAKGLLNQQKQDAADDKKKKQLSDQDIKEGQELDKYLGGGWSARGGQAGKVQGKVNAAEAAEQLIEQGKGQKDGLNSRQIEELAQSTATLLGGGASASARVEALVPHTLFGRAQSLKEWLSSDPQGAGQEKFVDQMAETVAREKQLAQQQLLQYKTEGLPSRSGLRQRNPELFNNILYGRQLDPSLIDQRGVYQIPKKSDGLVGGGAPDPKITDYAGQHGMSYQDAQALLAKRGYKGGQ